MHYLTRFVEFEASHRYWNPDFSTEENRRVFGRCVSPYGHGHNYRLGVTLAGRIDPRTGMVINITELDRLLKAITAEFDHTFINLDHPAFRTTIPTTESLAGYIRDGLETRLCEQDAAARLSRVRLFEDPTLWSEVSGGEGRHMASLTKSFGFSAAHRLHSPELSDAENRRIFGKCNNLHGHGHNYELEVTVTGRVDPQTGMVFDLAELMHVVEEVVVARFDHKHLNHETEEFRRLNPTGENIVRVIWDLLGERLGGRLSRVGLWETPRNFFEYRGEDAA